MPLPIFCVLEGTEQLALAGAATALARKSASLQLLVYQKEEDFFFPVMLLILKIQTIREAAFAVFSRMLQLCLVS